MKTELTAHSWLSGPPSYSFWPFFSSSLSTSYPRASPRTSLWDTLPTPAAQLVNRYSVLPSSPSVSSLPHVGIIAFSFIPQGSTTPRPSRPHLGQYLRFLRHPVTPFYILGLCLTLSFENSPGMPKAQRTGSKHLRSASRAL